MIISHSLIILTPFSRPPFFQFDFFLQCRAGKPSLLVALHRFQSTFCHNTRQCLLFVHQFFSMSPKKVTNFAHTSFQVVEHVLIP